MWGSRPSHFMINPNTKRHPNNTKTDQLPISEAITSLPRPYYNSRNKGVKRLENEVGTTQKIIPSMCVYEYKDGLDTRRAPAADVTAMLYSSLQECLEIVSHPNFCTGYIESRPPSNYFIPSTSLLPALLSSLLSQTPLLTSNTLYVIIIHIPCTTPPFSPTQH